MEAEPRSPGEIGVSEEAAERDLEIGAATKTDYSEFQRRIAAALAEVDPKLAQIPVVTTGDYTVDSAEEMVGALSRATEGQTVFVPSSARLDLTARDRIRIPPGVTLASGRGVDGSSGAMLYTNSLGIVLFVAEARSRIIGIDLMGPDPAARTYQLQRLKEEGGSELYYRVPTATGILVRGENVLIENCELWGWSHAAIHVGPGARDVTVRHCFIHHNQRLGLGYGVYLDESEALIEANLFDWYRHCVAGSGKPGTGYEARYNYILVNASGHAFDMHGGIDRGDGTNVAGSWMKIHGNIVEAAQFPALVLRGQPTGTVQIYGNRFRNPDPARTIVTPGSSERVVIGDNLFGVTSMRVKR